MMSPRGVFSVLVLSIYNSIAECHAFLNNFFRGYKKEYLRKLYVDPKSNVCSLFYACGLKVEVLPRFLYENSQKI